MDNDRLYIPYGLTTEPEQFSGFGKKEVRHCVAGIAFFGVVAALIYLFTANLTAVMATAIIGIAASIMMTRRDGTSQGDIIQIVSVDDDDDTATVYDELQYVEVLTTTASNGSDDVYQDGKVNEGATDDGDDEENELYATVTVVLQDRAQALRLAECENTSLHAVFICRGNDELKEECLKAQLEVLGGVSEDIPDEETEDISDSVIPTVPNIDDLVDVESEETDGE